MRNCCSFDFDNDELFKRFNSINEAMLAAFGNVITMLLNTAPWVRHVPLFDHFNYDVIMRLEQQVDAPGRASTSDKQ